jgi:hypothetical protein
VQPQYSETYTFYTLSDAGAQLWINGQLLINAGATSRPRNGAATIPMLAQQIYNIQMDYFYQNNGDAVAQLSWSSPSTPFSIIPQTQLYPCLQSAAGGDDDFAQQRRAMLTARRQRHSGATAAAAIQRRQPGCLSTSERPTCWARPPIRLTP